MRTLRHQIPFAIAAAAFLALLAILIHKSLQTNDSVLVYTLDDPYIHMAMAKNLADHGIFGVTRYRFSSSSSSPLWTLLLAISYKMAGVADWVPGILAALFALLTLYAGNSLCRILHIKGFSRTIVCLSIVYFTPMIAVVSTGMEHAMHACFAMILLNTTLRYANEPKRQTLICMSIAGVLAVATRYESLFLVAPLCLWLITLKFWKAAITLGLLSFLPVAVYGIFSVFNGSFILPNSLMLKGVFPSVGGTKALIYSLGYRGFGRLIETQHLYVVSILLLLGYSLFRKTGRRFPALALSLVGSIMLHLQFASTGWFYRYEAYLIAISLPILGGLFYDLRESISFQSLWKCNWTTIGALFLCAVLFLWPLHRRAKESLEQVVPASHHIYRQQYHMGQFVRQMYPSGVRIALNDLGAVAYYADADILDLWGLGTIEVARAKRKGKYDAEAVSQMFERHQTQVIMVYSNWFTGIWPETPIPVAEWTTTSNYFGKTVTFYALSDVVAEDTERRLRKYQKALPQSVEVIYFSTDRDRESPRGDPLPHH